MIKTTRAALALAGLLMTLALAACGLGRNSSQDQGGIDNPIVAATVNGKPIYVEDVRERAVQLGRLQEGEDLSANSDAFYLTLEELIQIRLFAMEAEARGLDRQADVRRQLENARERVLASAIYDELDTRATDPAAVERLYRENMSRLDQGQEIHLRHIQFETREMADAAKRRLDQGERFEVLALTLSLDAETRADGGDLGFRSTTDLAPPVRQAVQNAHVGDVLGPVQIGSTWHLVRIDDIRPRGAPSLESLRPQIINWLRYQEIMQLQDRLSRDARIVRLREPDTSMAPTVQTPVPADAQQQPAEAPDAQAPRAGQPAAPPFPFPMGPGGVAGETAQRPANPAASGAPPASTATGAPQTRTEQPAPPASAAPAHQPAPPPAQASSATPSPDQPLQ